MPVPVFPAVGPGAAGPVHELRGDPRVRIVASPRHARVLLVAGGIPAPHVDALRRVHDQLPHPRATVWWTSSTRGVHDLVPGAAPVDGDGPAVVAAVAAASDRLADDPGTSDPDLLPDEDPVPWRGVGPYGQGGEGMMGGTPYGRPLAMTAHARDGLALDRLDLRLGPFLVALPAGLVVEVGLQGEVVQDVHLDVGWRAAGAGPLWGGPVGDAPPAREHRNGPAGRLREGLRWLAQALPGAGLEAFAARSGVLAARSGALTAGRDAPADGAPTRGLRALARDVDRLVRLVRRSGVLAAGRGVGLIDPGDAPSGAARLVGDVAARWASRLHDLGEAAAGRPAASLAGYAAGDGLDWLAPSLVGGTVSGLVATLASLDLRLEPHPSAAAPR